MDLKKLTSTLLSADSIKELSSLTGTSKNDVSSVLTEALPALLGGAKDQAKGTNTAKGFADALAQHAKDDTGNLAGFLGNVATALGNVFVFMPYDVRQLVGYFFMASLVVALWKLIKR